MYSCVSFRCTTKWFTCSFLFRFSYARTHASLVAQSCPNLWGPLDCSLPGSSVHGILQARLLKQVAFLSPGDLPDPGIEPESPAAPCAIQFHVSFSFLTRLQGVFHCTCGSLPFPSCSGMPAGWRQPLVSGLPCLSGTSRAWAALCSGSPFLPAEGPSLNCWPWACVLRNRAFLHRRKSSCWRARAGWLRSCAAKRDLGVCWDLVTTAPSRVAVAKRLSPCPPPPDGHDRAAGTPPTWLRKRFASFCTRGPGASEVQIHWKEISLCLVLATKQESIRHWFRGDRLPHQGPRSRNSPAPNRGEAGGVVVRNGPLGGVGSVCIDFFFLPKPLNK